MATSVFNLQFDGDN